MIRPTAKQMQIWRLKTLATEILWDMKFFANKNSVDMTADFDAIDDIISMIDRLESNWQKARQAECRRAKKPGS